MIKSPSKPSRQEPRRLRTRAALLRAGAELLAARPIDAIAVNDIVETAGVAKGSFFNHFADKDAFADAIAGEIRARIEARVTAANVGVADPAERLARAIAGFAQFALTEPRDARIMLRGQARTAADHPLNRGVGGDLALGAAMGEFNLVTEEAAIIYVLGAGQALLAAIAYGAFSANSARRLTRDLLMLTLGGLGVGERRRKAAADRAADEIIVG